jgi:hypothetical protein
MSLSPSRKAQAVVGGGGEQQDQRDRRGQEGGVVDVALDRVQVGERAGEADGQEETEQDLGAGDEGAQLLKQLAVLALEPFFDVFVFGLFPEPLLDHVVSGHIVLPPGFGPDSTRSLEQPCVRGCVVGGVGSRKTQSDRPDDQRVLHSARPHHSPRGASEHS